LIKTWKRKSHLKEAYDLLTECEGVIINGGGITYPNQEFLTGCPDDIWLDVDDVQWGREIHIHLFSEDVKDIQFDGTIIFMEDTKGRNVRLTLLTKMVKDLPDQI